MNFSNVNDHPAYRECGNETEGFKSYLPVLLTGLILLIWPLLQRLVLWSDPTIGFVDPNIWLLLLFSLISFVVVLVLSWWLLKSGWQLLKLPAISQLVSQFKTLASWQQLSFFLASFALLLLVALGIFSAVI